jgi:hypothetical protein
MSNWASNHSKHKNKNKTTTWHKKPKGTKKEEKKPFFCPMAQSPQKVDPGSLLP